MTNNQQQPQKRAYKKKTSIQTSEDLGSLSFTELVEKANWHKDQFLKIQSLLKEGVQQILSLNLEAPSNPKHEPAFAHNYPVNSNVLFPGQQPNARLVTQSISTEDTFSSSFLPDVSVPSEFKSGDFVVQGIQPTPEVYEVVGKDETGELEKEVEELIELKKYM